MRLRHLDTFSGIGTISLGFEATGAIETVAFCEADPAARRVLAKHWPHVPCFHDVAELRGEDVGAVDILSGGFPCQDISQAGGRKGLAGKRSGLVRHQLRLIEELKPTYAVFENVTALRRRGLGEILRALVALRYDAEWHCVPGAAVGSPDIRDRLWLIAYPQRPDTHGLGSYPAPVDLFGGPELLDEQERLAGSLVSALSRSLARVGPAGGRQWRAEPGVRRVAARSPDVVHRLRLLGNCTKHRIAEAIGHAILEREAQLSAGLRLAAE
jgi:DNA (cytosine-5)-methyltransferase 1